MEKEVRWNQKKNRTSDNYEGEMRTPKVKSEQWLSLLTLLHTMQRSENSG